MGQLKCEKCGSTEFYKRNGIYICQYCGTQYQLEADEAANKEESAAKENRMKLKIVEDMRIYQEPETAYGDVNDRQASSYKIAESPKSWLVTLLLSIFLGPFGIHRFYSGKVGTGVIWILTAGIGGIGWIVDIIVIAVGKFKDKQGRPIVHNKR